MGFSRALRDLGGAALAGALVVGGGLPVAHADQARDKQWALSSYKAAQVVWPHSTGKGVVVAVIDAGVRATHVDLRGQVLPGIDLVFGGNGQTDYSPEGHGTGMASIIAGHGHGPNGEDGIKGLAPGAKILPIGIASGVPGNHPNTLPRAIRWAVDHGAQVINMSLGDDNADPAQEAAIAYAEQHNVVVVAASGNSGATDQEYPASWPGVIKVGAVDENGSLSTESTKGGVTVVAPGVDILRDSAGSDTEMFMGHGTSDATAYVSAIAALYRSAHPNLTAGQIVNYIIKTAIPPQGITTPDPGYGYGIASPDLTMAVSPGPASGPLPQATGGSSGGGSSSGGASSSASPGTTTTAASSSSSSGSSLGLILGVLAGVVIIVIIIVVVVRSRRRGGGGGNGGSGGGGGQPAYPAYPQAQPPQQAYQPPTGQYGQPSQQNPYGGAPNQQQYPPQQGYGGHGR